MTLVNMYDPSGHFWDTVFDIGFLIWSIVDVVRNPGDWKYWAALGVDIGLDSVRTVRSSSYIAERITIGIWQSRNTWKWLYHFDF